MNKTRNYRIIILSVCMIIAIACSSVTHVFAETVYYSNGLLYTYINNENVSIYGADEGTFEIDVPEYINNRKVFSIRNNAFMENTDIVSLNLSHASFLKSIGSFSFANCNQLSGELILPEALTSIGTAAFQGCSSLQSVIYDAQNGIVPNQCFSGCTELSNVTLNDSVTEIGYYAFSNCPNLTYIEIPASVASIAKSSFQNDTDITLGVYRNSYALEYVESNGINYIILDPEPTEPPTEPEPTEVPTEAPTEEPTVPATEAPTEVSVKYLGDVDGDGTVTSIDATLIQRHLCYIKTMISDEMIMMGDVDDDGIISIIDVSYMMRYLATIEVPYPIGEPISNN